MNLEETLRQGCLDHRCEEILPDRHMGSDNTADRLGPGRALCKVHDDCRSNFWAAQSESSLNNEYFQLRCRLSRKLHPIFFQMAFTAPIWPLIGRHTPLSICRLFPSFVSLRTARVSGSRRHGRVPIVKWAASTVACCRGTHGCPGPSRRFGAEAVQLQDCL